VGDGGETVSPGMNADDLHRWIESTPGGPSPLLSPFFLQADTGSNWFVLPTCSLRELLVVQGRAPINQLE